MSARMKVVGSLLFVVGAAELMLRNLELRTRIWTDLDRNYEIRHPDPRFDLSFGYLHVYIGEEHHKFALHRDQQQGWVLMSLLTGEGRWVQLAPTEFWEYVQSQEAAWGVARRAAYELNVIR